VSHPPSPAPGAEHSALSLVLAVLTYRRTSDLPELLPQLLEQAATVDDRTSVLVVDNDAEASARATVEALALPDVRYVVEPTPGIAAARNRVLDETRDADLLVFIDDDERPEPGWLAALVACQRAEGCAAVAGAVVPEVGAIEDPWILAGGFFVRQRHATGAEMPAASTANLLLDLRQVRALGDVRFDARFGLSGGSDTLFTRTLTRNGGRIVWCDEAVVTDHIRTQRLTRSWVLQRHFRSGNSWAMAGLDLEKGTLPRLRTRFRLTGHGLARILAGSLRSAWGTLTGSLRHRARGSRTTARGVGMTVGAWGAVYVEYKRERTSKPR
jgi:succinoglycan biosynthesis protein ExoM